MLSLQNILINDERKVPFIDYVNMFLLLTVSGIPVFNGSSKYLFVVFAFNLARFAVKRKKIDRQFLVLLFLLLVLSVAQCVWFSFVSIVTYAGLFIKITTAYLAVKNIDNFIEVFTRVLFLLSVIALGLFLVFNFFHSIEDTLYASRHFWDDPLSEQNTNLVFYNIHREEVFGEVEKDTLGLFGLTRNSGPFWEPGAFGGYLTLGIVFEYIVNGSKRKLWILVFLAALFTTFSTTAWVAILIFFLLNYTIINNKNKTLLLMIPFLVVGSGLIVMNVDFLGSKITKQFEGFTESKKYGGATGDDDTRLGSAMLDFEDIQRAPIFGTGPANETRYSPREQLFIRTNGITDLLVRYGPIAFTGLLVLLYYSFKTYFREFEVERFKQAATVTFIVLLVIAFSEAYFNQVFFWSLLFLHHNKMDVT